MICRWSTASTATWAECSSGCTASAANWALLSFPFDPSGATVRLQGLSDGGVRRIVVFSSDSVMHYQECTSNCLSLPGWGIASFGVSKDPDIAFDTAGLPRLFSTNQNLNPTRVWQHRCTQTPCSSAANWAGSELFDGGYVTGGVLGDGRTFFVTSDTTPYLITQVTEL